MELWFGAGGVGAKNHGIVEMVFMLTSELQSLQRLSRVRARRSYG